MSRHTPAHATLLVCSLFSVGVLAGAGTGWAAVARAQDPYHHLQRFADVLTRVEGNYVEPVSAEDLVDAALRGMVSRLDEHSRWLSADEVKALNDDARGNYEGIGVEVRRDGDTFAIAKVLPNGPAQFAGLAAGDRIVAINGEPAAALSMDDVAERLRGPRGEPVKLSVLRDGWSEPQEIPTVRDRVHLPAVEGFVVDEVAYVHLSQFQRGAARDLERLASDLRGAGATRGLVLDLRDNPGGLLEEAVAVTDLFLDTGLIVSTKGRVEAPAEYYATFGGFPREMPLVVLVNGLSASASEIVTGAVQDTGRAVIVGEPTYGKGSVQTLYTYPDDAALKLTIARYYTPSGEPVADHRGRVPDVLVGMPARTHRESVDLLEAKISALSVSEAEKAELLDLVDDLPPPKNASSDIPWEVHGAARLAVDPPLAVAVARLRGGG